MKHLNYTDTGEGPAVVLLHGFLENKNIWDPFTQEWSASHRIFNFDIAGHGQSETVDFLCNIPAIAAQIKEVLREKEIINYLLIGHSMGGYVALEMLQEARGIILVHSTAMADTPQKKVNRNIAINAIRNNKDASFLSSFAAQLFAAENIEKLQGEIQAIKEMFKAVQKDVLINIMESMRDRPDKRANLKLFKGLKHYIIGKEDPVLPCTELVSQAQEVNASFDILEKSGHMGFIEEKELFSELFRSLIKE